MASELRVNTLKDASGSNSVDMEYVANGSAKAWLNLDGTGTIAISDSLNKTSVTDTGTGDFDPQFTNNMNNAVYSGVGSTTAGSGAYSTVAIQSLTTSDYRLLVSDGGTAQEDTDPVMTQILGDLA